MSNNGQSRRLSKILSSIGRSGISQWARYVPQIAALEEPLKTQNDFDLKKASLSLRYRARSGEPLDPFAAPHGGSIFPR